MKAVYKNPKELATKLLDVVDSYREGLTTYEKFESTILTLIEKNEDRIYKNGFMPTKLVNFLGEDRKALIDEVSNKLDK
ncbi:TIGR04540 family protein [Clostridium folliculivorans]|uniref:Ribonuclease P n=1 Tax=Clostridium folliculivorans TaxID=2886038 RepID=A0A9W5Y1Q2_9CLOT|nr:TIGR04540 family protein [Clostridium folliculivorans]GKU24968.1 ribonuclease P [Clostridium folliculivorans]GKU31066.1 ribonuclease P [Clostridium folliculivorans]